MDNFNYCPLFWMLSTIPVIIFWHFLITQHRSEQPKVKRFLISSITNLVHELPHDLLNKILRILGSAAFSPLGGPSCPRKEKKILRIMFGSSLGGDAAQCPVFLPEIKLSQAVKKHAKLDNKFLKSCPILQDFFILCQGRLILRGLPSLFSPFAQDL